MVNEKRTKNSGTRILFRHPLLEKLSRTHISVPLSIFFGYSGVLLYWSLTSVSIPTETTLGLFLFGFIFFTWIEYLTHRYVFHMKTFTAMRVKMQYIIHGVHHEFPKDKDRLAMPPLLSVTISTLLLIIFRLLLRDFAFSFLSGFILGYASYLMVHYMVHVYQPPKNIFRVLWINHGIHHYKNGDSVYGVSSPFWDYVYGTLKTKTDSAAQAVHHHH